MKRYSTFLMLVGFAVLPLAAQQVRDASATVERVADATQVAMVREQLLRTFVRRNPEAVIRAASDVLPKVAFNALMREILDRAIDVEAQQRVATGVYSVVPAASREAWVFQVREQMRETLLKERK